MRLCLDLPSVSLGPYLPGAKYSLGAALPLKLSLLHSAKCLSVLSVKYLSVLFSTTACSRLPLWMLIQQPKFLLSSLAAGWHQSVGMAMLVSHVIEVNGEGRGWLVESDVCRPSTVTDGLRVGGPCKFTSSVAAHELPF